ASLFVVLAALVLGLATNSARNTLESVDHNIHSFATQLILLDRTLQLHGPEANEARQRLLRYTQHAATTLGDASPNASDQTAEGLLNDVGASLNAIRPDRADRLVLWNDAVVQFRKTVELRWVLVEQSEGTIPTALIVLLMLWLALIFASFGYRAPR